MTTLKKLEVVYVPIDALVAADYNPRAMSPEEEKTILRSLSEQGMVLPIVVNSNPNRKNVIIGGHQRWLLLKRLGHTEVPVTYQDRWPIEEEQNKN